MHGKAKEPLLSLSPMPLPAHADAKVPAGEARGRFAIAPGGTLNPNGLTPGKDYARPSVSAGTGQDNSSAPNAATEVASNAGTGAGHSPSAGGGSGNASGGLGEGSVGTGTGSGNTSGPGAGGNGNGKGRGMRGSGAGRSGDRNSGTGSGGGSGSGTGSFPGITIQGGEDENKANSNTPGIAIEPQPSYGMTVVSTASSGGGLEDFGVFENERVFTVYVPMKRSPDEDDPTWTLQYAVLKDSADAGDQQVIPPTPVMREWPRVPAELERKYAQRQVVISAVVDQDGKVSRVTIKQTPDPRVSDPIAQALAKWVFRPAQMGGQPVAVKILLGIPL
jgi:Gram-negative bacterial TonB protein C-terminal